MSSVKPAVMALVLGLFVSALGDDAEQGFLAFHQFPETAPADVAIALSIEDCVIGALRSNYDVVSQRLAVNIAAADVMQARGEFEPALFAEGGHTENSSVDTNDVIETTDTDSGEVGLSTKLVTGTELSLSTSYAESSDDTNGTGVVTARLTQPLLRGAGIKTTRASLVIAKRNRRISEQDLAGQMIDTAVSVQNAYWDLVSARERVAVQEDSLKFARELADLTVQKAEAGIMADSDTVEAQAAVYTREADVVGAHEAVRRIEDVLKEQLVLFEDPDNWSAVILPVTTPTLPDVDEDLLACLREAFENRPDYRSELLRLKNADLSLYLAKNGLLPKLDLVAQGERSAVADGPGDAFDAASSSDDEIWSVFLRLEIPLGNKSERASYRRSRAEREQRLVEMKKLELRVIREIRRALDALATSRKIVEATAKAVELEQKKLSNERTKLELGKSTTDNVVRFIQSLNIARLRHVQSVVGLRKEFVRFEQVKGTTLEPYGVTIETYY